MVAFPVYTSNFSAICDSTEGQYTTSTNYTTSSSTPTGINSTCGSTFDNHLTTVFGITKTVTNRKIVTNRVVFTNTIVQEEELPPLFTLQDLIPRKLNKKLLFKPQVSLKPCRKQFTSFFALLISKQGNY